MSRSEAEFIRQFGTREESGYAAIVWDDWLKVWKKACRWQLSVAVSASDHRPSE